jgi:AGZA family xanthine/uracil permease-like MFS transporter
VKKLERLFKLKEHGTDVKTEILAGVTTFLAMAYILAVNPSILGNVMDSGAVFTATAVASAIATFCMAFLANYPIALSAGMGLNAYFAYTVCLGELKDVPDPFTIALTAVFVEGIIFIIISVCKFREAIVNSIPMNLKYGITTGIGLFIALIGLKSAGVTVSNESTLVSMGSFASAPMVLCLVGVMIIAVLSHYKVKGSILIGIIATWILGMIAQATGWYVVGTDGTSLFPAFTAASFLPPSLAPTFCKFNFGWAFSHLPQFTAVMFSFLFVDLFDTVGTVIGVADQAGLLDEKGHMPRIGRVFLSDAIGTVVGAVLGTSTITSFVESSAGVGEGGRTGLTALTTGSLFILSLFLAPLFLAVPGFATAPALIIVGMYMMSSVTKMSFKGDVADTVSGYLAIVTMPFTYSISNGIMFGFLSWVIIKLCEKKHKDVNPVMYVICALFLLRIFSNVFNWG